MAQAEREKWQRHPQYNINWQPIQTAPQDGTCVRVRRVYKDEIIYEGDAVWAVRHPLAPYRFPLPPDALGRPALPLPANVDEPTWLLPDRMYRVPAPTHWLPSTT